MSSNRPFTRSQARKFGTPVAEIDSALLTSLLTTTTDRTTSGPENKDNSVSTDSPPILTPEISSDTKDTSNKKRKRAVNSKQKKIPLLIPQNKVTSNVKPKPETKRTRQPKPKTKVQQPPSPVAPVQVSEKPKRESKPKRKLKPIRKFQKKRKASDDSLPRFKMLQPKEKAEIRKMLGLLQMATGNVIPRLVTAYKNECQKYEALLKVTMSNTETKIQKLYSTDRRVLGDAVARFLTQQDVLRVGSGTELPAEDKITMDSLQVNTIQTFVELKPTKSDTLLTNLGTQPTTRTAEANVGILDDTSIKIEDVVESATIFAVPPVQNVAEMPELSMKTEDVKPMPEPVAQDVVPTPEPVDEVAFSMAEPVSEEDAKRTPEPVAEEDVEMVDYLVIETEDVVPQSATQPIQENINTAAVPMQEAEFVEPAIEPVAEESIANTMVIPVKTEVVEVAVSSTTGRRRQARTGKLDRGGNAEKPKWVPEVILSSTDDYDSEESSAPFEDIQRRSPGASMFPPILPHSAGIAAGRSPIRQGENQRSVSGVPSSPPMPWPMNPNMPNFYSYGMPYGQGAFPHFYNPYYF